VGSPTGREPYGDGGLVVVVGVTSHQGDWESQSQGEGDQVSVAGDRGGMRNAERHILCQASRVSGIQALESRVQLQAACPVRRGLVGKGAHKCHLASQLLYRMLRVRREARCRIPGAARRNLEECSWVTQLTWRRKPKGTIACWESGGGPKTLSGWVPQGPRAMVNA